MVIASYYLLFAAMSDSIQTVALESVVMIVFVIAAVVGFKSSAWIVFAGLAGHGFLMPFTVMLWKTQACMRGGRTFVLPTISELQRALPGFSSVD
jgi:hypothetical protein